MKTLITGSSGYIGNALVKAMEGEDVFTVDNWNRAKWVTGVGARSLTVPLTASPSLNIDLRDYGKVKEMLALAQPDTIVHLASQPSGPFSEIDEYHASMTQDGNVQMLRNLLYACKELGQSPQFIVTTTTGIPGAPDQEIPETMTPNIAGSTYHVSRGFDSANLNLKARQWGLRILEMRTSIVYGTRIDNHEEAVTRFDWDFYFGTALNRFCLLAKLGLSIEVYGKGEQLKPFISLRDCVTSLVNAIHSDIPVGHTIVNQTTHVVAIKDLAAMVSDKVEHIENPRKEKESHQMVMCNDKFLEYLPWHICGVLSYMQTEVDLMKEDIILSLLPDDWERAFYPPKVRP